MAAIYHSPIPTHRVRPSSPNSRFRHKTDLRGSCLAVTAYALSDVVKIHAESVRIEKWRIWTPIVSMALLPCAPGACHCSERERFIFSSYTLLPKGHV